MYLSSSSRGYGLQDLQSPHLRIRFHLIQYNVLQDVSHLPDHYHHKAFHLILSYTSQSLPENPWTVHSKHSSVYSFHYEHLSEAERLLSSLCILYEVHKHTPSDCPSPPLEDSALQLLLLL